MKLRGKITLAFLAGGLVPLLLGTLFTHTITQRALDDVGHIARQALEDRANAQVTAALAWKRSQLDDHAASMSDAIRVMLDSRMFVQVAALLRPAVGSYAEELGLSPADLRKRREALAEYYAGPFASEYERHQGAPLADPAALVQHLNDETVALQYDYLVENPHPPREKRNLDAAFTFTSYNAQHAITQPFLRAFVERLGFDDVLIIDAESGTVLYSVAKKIDFAVSLRDPLHRDSVLGRAFHEALGAAQGGAPHFTDLAPYLPAHGDPAGFLAAPFFDNGELIGVAAFQVSIDRINAIMRLSAGLGSTGEAILVGPDFLPRSDSPRPNDTRFTVARAFRNPAEGRVDIAPVRGVFEILSSGCGVYTDHRGDEALIAWAPVDFAGVTWALMTKLNTAEAFMAVGAMEHSADRFKHNMIYLGDLLAVATFILLGLAAIALARTITRPIQSTVAILRDMAEGEGDVTKRLRVDRSDEVGDLALWFNTFMDKVQRVYQSLSQEMRERERAQSELEQREQYFKSLIEYAPDVIVVTDPRGACVYVSPSYERIFGFAPAEILGKMHWEWLHPDDVERVTAGFAHLLTIPGAPYTAVGRSRCKDGSWKITESTATNRIGDPHVGGIVINMRDITDRVHAEEELRKSEAISRGILQTASEGIIAIREDGVIEFANPAAARLLGYAEGELHGTEALALVAEKSTGPYREAVEHYLQTGESDIIGKGARELSARKKDGTVFPVSVSVNVVDLGGRRLFTSFITDITARKDVERILKDYSAALERDVAERTIELIQKSKDLERAIEDLKGAQEQLVLNEKMASLGALTAGIAHEIKNPLNFINNFGELSSELAAELHALVEAHRARLAPDLAEEVEHLAKTLRQNTEKIVEHGKRADSIVRNMLLHSRGQPGVRQPTDINALLDEYVKLAYHGMRAKDASFNIAFDLHYDPEVGVLDVVPQDLSRVFLNILVNAFQAAAERRNTAENGYQPRLKVVTRNFRDRVEIVIEDNGVGIPRELLDKIFNPFFTTKPAGHGTGLGLSMSYDIIVREHRGQLLVNSEPGRRTEFTIVLPRS